MSDQAWAELIMTAYTLEDIKAMYDSENVPEQFEIFKYQVEQNALLVHPRYYKGNEYDRTQPTNEEIYEAWKAAIWKQAVLHGELKARMGLEPHWLLFYIGGMNLISHLRGGHTYEGYMPVMVYCDCCYSKPTIIEDPDNWPAFHPCEDCVKAGHEGGVNAYNRWHLWLGKWWVEISEDNGEDYFPSSSIAFVDEKNLGEAATEAEAKKIYSSIGNKEQVFIYRPDGSFYRYIA
jgi:hypothetical protein